MSRLLCLVILLAVHGHSASAQLCLVNVSSCPISSASWGGLHTLTGLGDSQCESWYFAGPTSANKGAALVEVAADLQSVTGINNSPIPPYLAPQGFDTLGNMFYFTHKLYVPVRRSSSPSSSSGSAIVVYETLTRNYTGSYTVLANETAMFAVIDYSTFHLYAAEPTASHLIVYDVVFSSESGGNSRSPTVAVEPALTCSDYQQKQKTKTVRSALNETVTFKRKPNLALSTPLTGVQAATLAGPNQLYVLTTPSTSTSTTTSSTVFSVVSVDLTTGAVTTLFTYSSAATSAPAVALPNLWGIEDALVHVALADGTLLHFAKC